MTGKELGNLGEKIAAEWLRVNKRFEIVERNFKHRGAEIDIVAMHHFDLHFIEVKTRTESTKAMITASLSDTKLRQLVKGAGGYITVQRMNGIDQMFFDLVCVIFSDDLSSHRVEYTPCFFYPDWNKPKPKRRY